jgi:hypothetical protein
MLAIQPQHLETNFLQLVLKADLFVTERHGWAVIQQEVHRWMNDRALGSMAEVPVQIAVRIKRLSGAGYEGQQRPVAVDLDAIAIPIPFWTVNVPQIVHLDLDIVHGGEGTCLAISV